jgi:hypothetical protein
MPNFPAAIKVYLCTVACDMRRRFEGLSMMAEHIIQSGHLPRIPGHPSGPGHSASTLTQDQYHP